MIKGGYKIVNFNGAALSGSSETLPGIYAQIVDDYDKPIMVSGVSLNGDIMDDAYASVQEKITGDLSKSVELTVYGGVITVTEDDEVTFVLAKSNTELTAEIGDLEDLETTEKGSVVDAVNEIKANSLKVTAEQTVVIGDVTANTDTEIGEIANLIPDGTTFVGTVLKTASGSSYVDSNTSLFVFRNSLYISPTHTQAGYTVVFRVLYI